MFLLLPLHYVPEGLPQDNVNNSCCVPCYHENRVLFCKLEPAKCIQIKTSFLSISNSYKAIECKFSSKKHIYIWYVDNAMFVNNKYCSHTFCVVHTCAHATFMISLNLEPCVIPCTLIFYRGVQQKKYMSTVLPFFSLSSRLKSNLIDLGKILCVTINKFTGKFCKLSDVYRYNWYV